MLIFLKKFLPHVRLIFILAVCACNGKKEKVEEKSDRIGLVPTFNSDSAYSFVAKQISFGPRIPNTSAHRATGDYLQSSFRKYGARVMAQEFQATTFDGKRLYLKNIIASYNPGKQKRILLAAHWDTRPFADKDPVNRDGKLDGANDGASGVSVLMEIARQLGSNPLPDIGVDLILFDGEDWGEKDNANGSIPPPAGLDSWWCLGSQYWARNKHRPGYSAYYGILLDMVGGQNARFFQEGNSVEFAPRIVEKVWNAAARLGFSSIFIRQKERAIVDDHLFINEIAKIPTIDITPFDPGRGYFGNFHHTQQDNISLINKEMLGIVGTVLLNVMYYEE